MIHRVSAKATGTRKNISGFFRKFLATPNMLKDGKLTRRQVEEIITLERRIYNLFPIDMANELTSQLSNVEARLRNEDGSVKLRLTGQHAVVHMFEVAFTVAADVAGNNIGLAFDRAILAAHHDSLELGLFSREDLRELVGDEKLEMVELLSHPKDITPWEYIRDYLPPIFEHPNAIAVKIADAANNLKTLASGDGRRVLTGLFAERTLGRAKEIFRIMQDFFPTQKEIEIYNILAQVDRGTYYSPAKICNIAYAVRHTMGKNGIPAK